MLRVAHIDHGMRGRASAADARFVARLAKQLALPCDVITLRLGTTASEDAARRARLDTLAKLARKHRCHAVLLAHHADDQAETVLLHMIRGCGLDGLAAMQDRQTLTINRRKITLVRPLLSLTRAELHTYLHDLHQPWREDQTNTSPRFARNRIRHEVLPLLESIRPGVANRLNQLAAIAADAQSLIETAAAAIRPTPTPRRRSTLVFTRKALREIHPLLLREFLRQAPASLRRPMPAFTFERLREASHAIAHAKQPAHIELGHGYAVHITATQVVIKHNA